MMHPELKKLYKCMAKEQTRYDTINVRVIKEPYYWYTIYVGTFNDYITLVPND